MNELKFTFSFGHLEGTYSMDDFKVEVDVTEEAVEKLLPKVESLIEIVQRSKIQPKGDATCAASETAHAKENIAAARKSIKAAKDAISNME